MIIYHDSSNNNDNDCSDVFYYFNIFIKLCQLSNFYNIVNVQQFHLVICSM